MSEGVPDYGECVTRFCLKGLHDSCSGTVTFGWLPTKPCTCFCHDEPRTALAPESVADEK